MCAPSYRTEFQRYSTMIRVWGSARTGSDSAVWLANCYFANNSIAFSFLLRIIRVLWFAKTSAETQAGAVLGGVGVNTIIGSIQQEDSGVGEPACAWSAHI